MVFFRGPGRGDVNHLNHLNHLDHLNCLFRHPPLEKYDSSDSSLESLEPLESLESLVNSKPGSALLIAGKGNENYQEFENGFRKDFSDFEVVMRFKNAI